MTDAFDELRAPDLPVDPDPAFAASLRVRLQRALALPEGVEPMTTDQLAEPTDRPATAEPLGAAVPYLAVRDARRALGWYQDVFGAVPDGDPIVMPDGRIGHAQLRIGAGMLYLADEHPEIGVTAPSPAGAAVSLMLPVTDADATRARALAAGATGDREPYDGYGQRNAWIVDPFGHRWGLHSPLPSPAAPPVAYRPGDVVHVSLQTPDVDRTRAFYSRLLGWSYLPDGRVAGATPSVGFRPSPEPMVTCDYAVADLAAAVDRVRSAGGSPGAIERHPWGVVAECVDDQGVPFRLHETAATDGTPPPVNGRRTGDPAYLTYEVVDSARSRAFYDSVLGWTFAPGSIEDGWQVDEVAPMSGLSGGHPHPGLIPMWRVADLNHAVDTVRALGGTATDPARQPYGRTSECADDQGLRFYLGEM